MTTLEERLAKIETKVKNDKEKTDNVLKELNEKKTKLLKEIKELTPRINDILTLANKCLELNINLPTKLVINGKDYGFVADSFYHQVGLMRNSTKYEYLGRYAGGWCGIWDFYTNGEETFLKNEKNNAIDNGNNEETLRQLVGDMSKFLKDFEQYEICFNKWIDALS